MPQAPKPISETTSPVRPSARYFIIDQYTTVIPSAARYPAAAPCPRKLWKLWKLISRRFPGHEGVVLMTEMGVEALIEYDAAMHKRTRKRNPRPKCPAHWTVDIPAGAGMLAPPPCGRSCRQDSVVAGELGGDGRG